MRESDCSDVRGERVSTSTAAPASLIRPPLPQVQIHKGQPMDKVNQRVRIWSMAQLLPLCTCSKTLPAMEPALAAFQLL